MLKLFIQIEQRLKLQDSYKQNRDKDHKDNRVFTNINIILQLQEKQK